MTEQANDHDQPELCSCGFSAEMHCMHCGECPRDEEGTLGYGICVGLGLWTEEGEVEAPCVSENMLICPWCGEDVTKDDCKHQARVAFADVDEYESMIKGEYYRVVYEPTSGPGNSSVVFLYVFEDEKVAEQIRNS